MSTIIANLMFHPFFSVIYFTRCFKQCFGQSTVSISASTSWTTSKMMSWKQAGNFWLPISCLFTQHQCPPFSTKTFFWNKKSCKRPKYYEQSIIQEQMESCARKYNCNIHAIYIFNYVELNIIEILKNNCSVCKWWFSKLHPLNL